MHGEFIVDFTHTRLELGHHTGEFFLMLAGDFTVQSDDSGIRGFNSQVPYLNLGFRMWSQNSFELGGCRTGGSRNEREGDAMLRLNGEPRLIPSVRIRVEVSVGEILLAKRIHSIEPGLISAGCSATIRRPSASIRLPEIIGTDEALRRVSHTDRAVLLQLVR